ncbi:MAG: hypothetical protein ABF330_12310 [Lentimonas sp.]
MCLAGYDLQTPETDSTESQSQGVEQSTPLWEQFYQVSSGGRECVLPDYSHDGYALGEVGIPEISGKVFNVVDFGAVLEAVWYFFTRAFFGQ